VNPVIQALLVPKNQVRKMVGAADIAEMGLPSDFDCVKLHPGHYDEDLLVNYTSIIKHQ
jgi:hypothetical protein